jgi:hypothetical protein
MHILPKTITDKVTIKNIKTNFGHDLGGFFCDIYHNKKKVGYLNVDGWGGCPDVRPYDFTEKGAKLFKGFEDFLKEENFAQFQADYYKKPHPKMAFHKDDWKALDFSFEDQVWFLCERLNYLNIIKKEEKKAIVVGNPINAGLSKFNLKQTIESIKENNPIQLKQLIHKIKSKLKEGEFILNTNLDEFLK